MSDYSHAGGPGFRPRTSEPPASPEVRPELYEGVIARRIAAFLIDIVFIGALLLLGYAAVFILGVLTLGLAWLAFGLVFPGIALAYHALTIGGSWSATPGMRLLGLEIVETGGGRPSWVIGLAHPIIFYVSSSLTAMLILLIALFDSRGRTLHDMITGVVVVNRMEA